MHKRTCMFVYMHASMHAPNTRLPAHVCPYALMKCMDTQDAHGELSRSEARHTRNSPAAAPGFAVDPTVLSHDGRIDLWHHPSTASLMLAPARKPAHDHASKRVRCSCLSAFLAIRPCGRWSDTTPTWPLSWHARACPHRLLLAACPQPSCH